MKSQLKFALLLALGTGVLGAGAAAQESQVNVVAGGSGHVCDVQSQPGRDSAAGRSIAGAVMETATATTAVAITCTPRQAAVMRTTATGTTRHRYPRPTMRLTGVGTTAKDVGMLMTGIATETAVVR